MWRALGAGIDFFHALLMTAWVLGLPLLFSHRRPRWTRIYSVYAIAFITVSQLSRAAAKAGIELLTQDVAAQVGPYNIRVNCIAPETILTDRNKERIPEAQQGELVNAHPIRRLGTPGDVARAALFLASDDAAWITGIILDVAGGATMVR